MGCGTGTNRIGTEFELSVNFVPFSVKDMASSDSRTGPSRITELPNELTTDIDACSPVVSEN